MARIVGVILLLAGLAGLAWGGFTYRQERHNVDLGPVDFSVTEKKTVPIPPIAGAVAMIAGLVLLVAGSKRGALE
jgi:drug/metabolite transporter (DMT)-like permease